MSVMSPISFANERFDLLNLLRVALFGNNEITEYIPGNTYNRNDLVYTYDETTYIVTVYRCIVDVTTSDEINSSEWTSSFAGTHETIREIVYKEPTNPETLFWYKQVGEIQTHMLPE